MKQFAILLMLAAFGVLGTGCDKKADQNNTPADGGTVKEGKNLPDGDSVPE